MLPTLTFASAEGYTLVNGVLTVETDAAMEQQGWKAQSASVESVKLLPGVTKIVPMAFENYYALKTVEIPNTVTDIGYRAFENCYALTGVVLPDSVEYLGARAFCNCRSLKTVKLSANLTSLTPHVFENCAALERMDLPDGMTSLINSALANCGSLMDVTVPDSVTSIADNVFKNSLKVILRGSKGSYAESYALQYDLGFNVTWSFDEATGVMTVSGKGAFPGYGTWPAGMKKLVIGEGITYLRSKAFALCSQLTEVTLPESLTGIGIGVFASTGLQRVDIPDAVTFIGYGAFRGCKALASLHLPESLVTMQPYAFSDCASLKSVVIPAKAELIDACAFYNCPKLERVLMLSTETEMDVQIFDGCEELTLYAHAGSSAEDYAAENSISFVSLESKLPYADAAEGDWFYEAARYTYFYGLMNGMSPTAFEPDTTMSRAMLVTVLYRMEGSPTVSGTEPFKDVNSLDWFAEEVLWAYQNGIVDGMTPTTFEPNGEVTRAQTVTMLYRYAKFAGRDVSARADLGSFSDAAAVDGWALEAMQWAVAEGIVSGIGDRLAPDGGATRAQLATILMRYNEN